MPPKGRKPKPKSSKVLKGTFRKDRDNPDAPVAAPDGMRAPAFLSREAVEHFGVLKSRVEAYGLNSSSYTEAMALAAMRMAEIEECDELIEQFGRVYETKSVKGGYMVKANPAVGQRNEAMRHLQSLLAEFGLTPASISKVHTGGGKNENSNPFGAFGGGHG